jgi:hypothetical protein
MKQITSLWEMVGKTIENVSKMGPRLGLRFEDGSYIVFTVEVDDLYIQIDEEPIDPRLLRDLGVIDHAECQTLLGLREAAAKRKEEEHDYQYFLTLKKRFEP